MESKIYDDGVFRAEDKCRLVRDILESPDDQLDEDILDSPGSNNAGLHLFSWWKGLPESRMKKNITVTLKVFSQGLQPTASPGSVKVSAKDTYNPARTVPKPVITEKSTPSFVPSSNIQAENATRFSTDFSSTSSYLTTCFTITDKCDNISTQASFVQTEAAASVCIKDGSSTAALTRNGVKSSTIGTPIAQVVDVTVLQKATNPPEVAKTQGVPVNSLPLGAFDGLIIPIYQDVTPSPQEYPNETLVTETAETNEALEKIMSSERPDTVDRQTKRATDIPQMLDVVSSSLMNNENGRSLKIVNSFLPENNSHFKPQKANLSHHLAPYYVTRSPDFFALNVNRTATSFSGMVNVKNSTWETGKYESQTENIGSDEQKVMNCKKKNVDMIFQNVTLSVNPNTLQKSVKSSEGDMKRYKSSKQTNMSNDNSSNSPPFKNLILTYPEVDNPFIKPDTANSSQANSSLLHGIHNNLEGTGNMIHSKELENPVQKSRFKEFDSTNTSSTQNIMFAKINATPKGWNISPSTKAQINTLGFGNVDPNVSFKENSNYKNVSYQAKVLKSPHKFESVPEIIGDFPIEIVNKTELHTPLKSFLVHPDVLPKKASSGASPNSLPNKLNNVPDNVSKSGDLLGFPLKIDNITLPLLANNSVPLKGNFISSNLSSVENNRPQTDATLGFPILSENRTHSNPLNTGNSVPNIENIDSTNDSSAQNSVPQHEVIFDSTNESGTVTPTNQFISKNPLFNLNIWVNGNIDFPISSFNPNQMSNGQAVLHTENATQVYSPYDESMPAVNIDFTNGSIVQDNASQSKNTVNSLHETETLKQTLHPQNNFKNSNISSDGNANPLNCSSFTNSTHQPNVFDSLINVENMAQAQPESTLPNVNMSFDWNIVFSSFNSTPNSESQPEIKLKSLSMPDKNNVFHTDYILPNPNFLTESSINSQSSQSGDHIKSANTTQNYSSEYKPSRQDLAPEKNIDSSKFNVTELEVPQEENYVSRAEHSVNSSLKNENIAEKLTLTSDKPLLNLSISCKDIGFTTANPGWNNVPQVQFPLGIKADNITPPDSLLLKSNDYLPIQSNVSFQVNTDPKHINPVNLTSNNFLHSENTTHSASLWEGTISNVSSLKSNVSSAEFLIDIPFEMQNVTKLDPLQLNFPNNLLKENFAKENFSSDQKSVFEGGVICVSPSVIDKKTQQLNSNSPLTSLQDLFKENMDFTNGSFVKNSASQPVDMNETIAQANKLNSEILISIPSYPLLSSRDTSDINSVQTNISQSANIQNPIKIDPFNSEGFPNCNVLLTENSTNIISAANNVSEPGGILSYSRSSTLPKTPLDPSNMSGNNSVLIEGSITAENAYPDSHTESKAERLIQIDPLRNFFSSFFPMTENDGKESSGKTSVSKDKYNENIPPSGLLGKQMKTKNQSSLKNNLTQLEGILNNYNTLTNVSSDVRNPNSKVNISSSENMMPENTPRETENLNQKINNNEAEFEKTLKNEKMNYEKHFGMFPNESVAQESRNSNMNDFKPIIASTEELDTNVGNHQSNRYNEPQIGKQEFLREKQIVMPLTFSQRPICSPHIQKLNKVNVAQEPYNKNRKTYVNQEEINKESNKLDNINENCGSEQKDSSGFGNTLNLNKRKTYQKNELKKEFQQNVKIKQRNLPLRPQIADNQLFSSNSHVVVDDGLNKLRSYVEEIDGGGCNNVTCSNPVKIYYKYNDSFLAQQRFNGQSLLDICKNITCQGDNILAPCCGSKQICSPNVMCKGEDFSYLLPIPVKSSTTTPGPKGNLNNKTSFQSENEDNLNIPYVRVARDNTLNDLVRFQLMHGVSAPDEKELMNALREVNFQVQKVNREFHPEIVAASPLSPNVVEGQIVPPLETMPQVIDTGKVLGNLNPPLVESGINTQLSPNNEGKYRTIRNYGLNNQLEYLKESNSILGRLRNEAEQEARNILELEVKRRQEEEKFLKQKEENLKQLRAIQDLQEKEYEKISDDRKKNSPVYAPITSNSAKLKEGSYSKLVRQIKKSDSMNDIKDLLFDRYSELQSNASNYANNVNYVPQANLMDGNFSGKKNSDLGIESSINGLSFPIVKVKNTDNERPDETPQRVKRKAKRRKKENIIFLNEGTKTSVPDIRDFKEKFNSLYNDLSNLEKYVTNIEGHSKIVAEANGNPYVMNNSSFIKLNEVR